MASAIDICNHAAEIIGVRAQAEALSAADAQSVRYRLNAMVSGWRTQFGTVVAVDRQIFPLTANKQTYTIGVGGDFNVPRPLTIVAAGLLLNGLDAAVSVTIARAGYIATVTQTAHGYAIGDETLIQGANELDYNGVQTVASVPTSNTFTYVVDGTAVTPATGPITAAPLSYQPLEIPRPVITNDAYQSIQIKGLPNAQFTTVYYNATYPFGTVFLWPLPNTAQNQLVLYLQNAFAGFADLVTPYDWPDLPGYLDALEFNLAVRVSSSFGVNITEYPQVVDLARDTLGIIKRANNQLTDLPTDASVLTYNRRGGYNINTGTGGT